jgi:hypothetical protein
MQGLLSDIGGMNGETLLAFWPEPHAMQADTRKGVGA